jgi:hypothetical protein
MELGRINSCVGGFKAKYLADRARIAFMSPTLCIYPLEVRKNEDEVTQATAYR